MTATRPDDHKPKGDEAQAAAGSAADLRARTLPSWETMYDKLVEYKRQSPTNDANAPKDGGVLGRWLAYQREKYNKNELSLDREDLLVDLGVCMRPLDMRWETQFNAAVQYKRRTDKWPPTTDPIGSWAAKQRQLLKRHLTTRWCMDPYRLNKLLAVGMVVNLQQEMWEVLLAWVDQWATRSCFKPLPRTETYSYIARWCKAQARAFAQPLPAKASQRKTAIERRRMAAPLMVPYFLLDQPAPAEEGSEYVPSPQESEQSDTKQLPPLRYAPVDARGGPAHERKTSQAPAAAAAAAAAPRPSSGKRPRRTLCAEPPPVVTVKPEPPSPPTLRPLASAGGASSAAPRPAPDRLPSLWPVRGTRAERHSADTQWSTSPPPRLPSFNTVVAFALGKRSAEPPADEVPSKRRRTRK